VLGALAAIMQPLIVWCHQTTKRAAAVIVAMMMQKNNKY
jgi:hypothetical protein